MKQTDNSRYAQDQARARLLDAHGLYVQAIKYKDKRERDASGNDFRQARQYAAAMGVDVSGFADERYEKILPVQVKEKRRWS